MKKAIYLILSILIVCSCDKYDFFGIIANTGPDVDSRFLQSEEYNASNPKAPRTAKANSYRFYLCTDIHIDDKTEFTDAYVSACLSDEGAEPFSFCLGDMISRKGKADFAANVLKPLRENGRELMCVAGNHDIYFGEWSEYFRNWGSSTYCFEVRTPSAGTDLYIFLESSGGTLGSAQKNWLKERLNEAGGKSYRHILALSHSNFFDEDKSQGTSGNYPLEETYELLGMFSNAGVDYVLTGHDHNFCQSEFKGVMYYTLNSLTEMQGKGGYYIVTVSDGLDLKFIEQARK